MHGIGSIGSGAGGALRMVGEGNMDGFSDGVLVEGEVDGSDECI